MITEILCGNEAIRRGKELILSGSVVAFPTETVYGLGANAYNADAINEIFKAKERPQDNPLIVHIADIKEIYKITKEVSYDALKLANAFMPGPLTLVLKKNDLIPYCVTAGLSTVAIRMPNHKIALELIRAAGVPIAAPSANKSMHISPTSMEHVRDDLNGRIPLIIDGGQCSVGIESTVIDMSGENINILRPGYITKAMIEKVLNREVGEKTSTTGAPSSPGMKYRHYAPKQPMTIYKSCDEICEAYDNLIIKNKKPVIITSNNTDYYMDRHIINVGETREEIARNIYAAMRKAENSYDIILCEDFNDSEIGHSIMNRLNKAAEKIKK